jgi:hypothetical protein
MKIYLSGWQATNRERESVVLNAGAMKNRCFSFCSIQKLPGLPYFLKNVEGAYQACLENKVGIMMDSGVVGYRSYRQALIKQGGKALNKLLTQDTFIDLYVEYCKKNKKYWDFYVTIDIEKKSDLILATHTRLLEAGIKPVPVLHGDADVIEYLKKYHDLGHKLICLGTGSHLRTTPRHFRHYLDSVFNEGAKLGVEFHGLAMTSPWIMLEYPWYAVDSSSWSRMAGYGTICRFDEQTHRMCSFHISERESKGAKGADLKGNTAFMRILKKEIEAEGYDFDLLRKDFVLRHAYNAATMQELCDYATTRHRTGWKLLF